MNLKTEEILKLLAQHLNPENTEYQKLITSGRHFQEWLQPRIKNNQQILVNAIIYQSDEMQNHLNWVLSQIQKEFDGLAMIQSLPYPYDDLDLMKIVVNDVIEHFKSPISREEVIQDLSGTNRIRGERTGYIIITIINSPVII